MIICKNCGKIFNKKDHLKYHSESNNCIVYDISSINIFKCNYCKRIFPDKWKLNRHINSMRGNCFKKRNKCLVDKQINNYTSLENINEQKNYMKNRGETLINNQQTIKEYKRKKISQPTRIKIAASQLWKCKHCKMLFNEGGWDINHIVRVSLGGTNELSNLEALCKNCHGIVTANERIRDGF